MDNLADHITAWRRKIEARLAACGIDADPKDFLDDLFNRAIDEIERLRAQGATLREQHKQAHENSAKIFSALVDISVLTPLGGEVADYADVVAAVRALWEDAERWRLARKWFRVMSPHIDGNHGWCPTGEWGRVKGPSIDAAIDAARKAPPA